MTSVGCVPADTECADCSGAVPWNARWQGSKSV